MRALLFICFSLLTWTGWTQSLPGEMYYSEDGKILYTGGRPPEGCYQKDIIRSVYLDFGQSNWWLQLTNNYATETEIPATMTVDGTVYDSVGVRFRGNTSYFQIGNSQKKSFAVTTDFVHGNQDFMGYNNLKFNNAHQDATFMREVLYCQMAARHTPIAKANFIELYLNGEYWGIYPNIQSVDKTFLKEYFLSNDGPRFRATTEETGPGGGGGGPGWGDGTAGLNDLGPDTATYQQYYDLKSSDIENPWQTLVDACHLLGTATADNTDEVLAGIDVDKALWFLAVENIFTDDDSYTMKGKMDYCIYYEPETGRTTPLEYDGNSSFQTNAATSNNWGPFKNVSNINYPLLNKLLNIPQWRQRYLAHYRTILNETFTTANANTLIDTIDARIRTLVNNDPKKLYSFNQYTSGVPSLKTFVANRRTFLLSNAEVAQVAPVITDASYTNSALQQDVPPLADEGVYVRSTIQSTSGISNVYLYYAPGLTGNFTKSQMYDDGLHEDGIAGDSVFGGSIPGFPTGTIIRYYVEAIAANSALSASYLPAGAEHDVFVYTVQAPANNNGVVINEILASNDSGATDEAGQLEDWVELFNNNDFDVDLSGYYITDDAANLDKWQIPSGTTIGAKGYLIIWADEDQGQGPLHTNFKISASGETIVLSDTSLNEVDLVDFGAQTTDVAYARIPNGTGGFILQAPTFNINNESTTAVPEVQLNNLLLYPNPTDDEVYVQLRGSEEPCPYIVTDLQGKVISTGNVSTMASTISMKDLADGMYVIKISGYVPGKIIKH